MPTFRFEFDPAKSATNRLKHGIDFIAAQTLWRSKYVEARIDRPGEQRYAIFGVIGAKHWTAVITYRGMTVRIISVRLSTPAEIAFYAAH